MRFASGPILGGLPTGKRTREARRGKAGGLAMKGALLGLFGLITASTFGNWIYDWWHGPLHLACHGQMVKTTQGIGREQTDTTLHVEVDFGKATVWVEDFFPPYKMEPGGSTDLMDLSDPTGTVNDGGYINRYTGTIGVSKKYTDWAVTFNGLCRPAERLF